MDAALRILEFIIALGVLIFIHEFGHYIFCRIFGIEVEEFGFGFPPRLVKLFTFQGTDFTLNWIPFGAFVKPRGETDPDAPGGLSSAPAWKRLLVFLGGPILNLLAAVLLIGLVFSQTGVADRSKVLILEVAPSSPAAEAGLLPQDQVKMINDVPIQRIEDLSSQVSANLGKEISLTLVRDGKELVAQATPRVNPPPNEGALGIMMGYSVTRVNYLEALPSAVREVGYQIENLVTLPGKLIRGQVNGDEARVVGVVGMFSIYDVVREQDQEISQERKTFLPISTLALLGTISAALGITNLLPLPALDGGRILFLLPELFFGKRIPQQYENLVHSIGFILLIVLMIFITFQDIFNPINLR